MARTVGGRDSGAGGLVPSMTTCAVHDREPHSRVTMGQILTALLIHAYAVPVQSTNALVHYIIK